MFIDLGNTGNNINFAPGGGGCKLEPRRAASIRTNGLYNYDPAEGYDGLEGMDVDVDVPQSTLQDNKTVTYTANGDYNVLPDEGYDAIKKSTVTVNVPIKNVEASKTVTYTENGDYTISPDSGYDGIAGASVKVNVTSPTPVQTVDLDTGISFAESLFTTMPFALTGGGNRRNMGNMFSNCYNLTSLDLSSFNTSKVTNMKYMFNNCNRLTSLDLSNFNTSKVTNMGSMFSSCNRFTSLDLSNFDTSKVTYMGSMFSGCDSLTTVKVINCNDATKQKILAQLQTDITTKTWTLGDDGIITGVAKS